MSRVIHPSVQKVSSANLACTEFSEVRLQRRVHLEGLGALAKRGHVMAYPMCASKLMIAVPIHHLPGLALLPVVAPGAATGEAEHAQGMHPQPYPQPRSGQ